MGRDDDRYSGLAASRDAHGYNTELPHTASQGNIRRKTSTPAFLAVRCRSFGYSSTLVGVIGAGSKAMAQSAEPRCLARFRTELSRLLCSEVGVELSSRGPTVSMCLCFVFRC